MSYTVINATDTLEQMRVKLNSLTQNDFGDIATLDPGLSATSVIGAVNELSGQVTTSLGFSIEDSLGNIQAISPGNTLNINGTANQVNAIVSVPDTLTISFVNDVVMPNDLTVTNTALIDGTLTIATGSITDSTGQISFSDENLITTGTINAGDATVTSLSSTGAVSGTTITGSSTVTGTNLVLTTNGTLTFEGSLNNDFETTLTVVNPTADRTITLPNITGTIITTGDTGTVSTNVIANNAISQSKIADDAVGQDQLKSVVSLSILNSSGGVLKTLYGAGA
mgnify:CR=1 FL=1